MRKIKDCHSEIFAKDKYKNIFYRLLNAQVCLKILSRFFYGSRIVKTNENYIMC